MNLMNIDLRLLKVFMAVVDAGGFAAAEDALNISTSTISTHISTLETRVGARLCRRGRSGFALTDEGQHILEAAKDLVGAMETFSARIRSLREGSAVILRVGVSEGIAADPRIGLPGAIRMFGEKVPLPELVLSSGHPNELQASLASRKLDVAIIGLPSDLPLLKHKSIRLEVLQEWKMQLCCGIGHPLFAFPERSIDLAEIRRHQFVARSNWTKDFLRRVNVPTPRVMAESFEGVLALVSSGLYLGYLTPEIAGYGIGRGQLRSLDIPQLRRTTSICFACGSEGEHNKLVKLFRRYVHLAMRMNQAEPQR